jgi:hypothetical protein
LIFNLLFLRVEEKRKAPIVGRELEARVDEREEEEEEFKIEEDDERNEDEDDDEDDDDDVIR